MADSRIGGDLYVAGDLQANTYTMSNGTLLRSKLTQEALAVYPINLASGRVHDDVSDLLPDAAANDDLELAGGAFGTGSWHLVGVDFGATNTTGYARFMVPLPAEYDAAQTINIRLSAGMLTTVADNAATCDVECYLSGRNALKSGSDLCTTAAQSCNSLTFADKDFVITATGLTAGDILDLRVTLYGIDAGNLGVMQVAIGAIELLCDIKG